jgi:hypothetical protein
MALYEPVLPARYLVPLLDVVAQMREGDRRKVAALAALDGIDAASATAVLPLSEVEGLLEAVSQLTGRQDLGFEIGRRLTLDHHGALAVDAALHEHRPAVASSYPIFAANHARALARLSAASRIW